MGLFTKKAFGSLDDVFMEQIEDLYDVEKRLLNALPKMAEASEMSELADAFNSHLGETEQHVERLERVFQELGKEPRRESCEGIKGLISEGSEMISANAGPGVKDAALIAAAQRIEHYEIAGYGTARSLAQHLGHSKVVRLLQQTLDEEGEADKKLTAIAEGGIYKSKAPKGGGAKLAAKNEQSNGRAKSRSAKSGKAKSTKSRASAGGGKASARGKSKKRSRAVAS